jgi:AraC family transcriptional regulator of adaptative response/methylated-DNA-[protein]-cysteine methyltransferase
MQRNRQYKLVSETIQWVAEHQSAQPDLQSLSSEMGVSPHHLQRTFQKWAGVSPKQFLKSLTRNAALERLKTGSSVLDAALESGLSGPGRLHDLMISTDALTPGEIRQHGQGVQLDYGFGETLFGQALIAWTPRGINFLGFSGENGAELTLATLQEQWAKANFRESSTAAQKQLDTIFSDSNDKPLALWLRGSPFQLKVWEALLEIPDGTHSSYGQLAARIGQPGAARAVGTAVGSNPVAWIIPCHRVIRKMGELGGYRWGGYTKQAMIGYEAASAAL